ncbi:LOW QUALITY PROTEIN: uncharacterized protein RB166_003342 [Leptodactylus fuscus]
MGWWEEHTIFTPNNPFLDNIAFYARYIDDVLLVWSGEEKTATAFTDHISSNSHNLKFTSQLSPVTVNFLDITLTGDDIKGVVESKLYRKPQSGNTTLHAKSHHPQHTIKSVPVGELTRAKRICSQEQEYTEECKYKIFNQKNFTGCYHNGQLHRDHQDSHTIQIVRSTLLAIILLCFLLFLYFVSIISRLFFTSPHVREKPRYILFIHMTINDTLLLSVNLFLAAIYLVYIPVPICYALVTFSACASRITPYNLAIMSLERYVAICHPLRHAEICTIRRSLLVIAAMWLLTLTPQILDFVTMCYSMPNKFFFTSVICTWPTFVMNKFQDTSRSIIQISTFTLVGLVILYTYVKVMVVARKIGSGKSSAFKAEKTVLLHVLQLGLCMMSFTITFTDLYLREYFFFVPITNFLLFRFIPRFISPLIYGIRDEVFRKHMRKIIFSI